MKQTGLPQRVILLIDGNVAARTTLLHELQARFTCFSVADFSDSEASLEWIHDPKQQATSEPVVAISDRVGIRFLRQVGAKGAYYPSTKKILYSGAAPKVAAKWKEEGAIDSFVRRGETSKLMKEIDHSIDSYERESVLADLREYIEKKCAAPDEPYYPTGDGHFLSIRDVYHEVLRNTLLGRRAADSWKGMRAARAKPMASVDRK